MTPDVPPHPDHSVTKALERLKCGDEQAALDIWNRYYKRLAGLARKKLRELPQRAEEANDVANRVFWSFCRGLDKGRFPGLNDRDDLWSLLCTITERKAIDRWRHYQSGKEGGGIVRDESSLERGNEEPGPSALNAFPDRGASLDELVELRDELAHLLGKLNDPVLRRVAQLRLDSATRSEIATELGVSVPTVGRKLRLIREMWADELPPEVRNAGPIGDA